MVWVYIQFVWKHSIYLKCWFSRSNQSIVYLKYVWKFPEMLDTLSFLGLFPEYSLSFFRDFQSIALGVKFRVKMCNFYRYLSIFSILELWLRVLYKNSIHRIFEQNSITIQVLIWSQYWTDFYSKKIYSMSIHSLRPFLLVLYVVHIMETFLWSSFMAIVSTIC